MENKKLHITKYSIRIHYCNSNIFFNKMIVHHNNYETVREEITNQLLYLLKNK